jgi:hypothetical protein
VLTRIGYLLDDRKFHEIEDLMTMDVMVEMPLATHKGRDGLADWTAQALSAMEATLHLSSNFDINIDGDNAEARGKVFVVGVGDLQRRDSVFGMGGIYTWSLIRTPQGWRVALYKFEQICHTGQNFRRDRAPT